MTDTTVNKVTPPKGNGQIISAIISAFLASYFMTQLSLAGVNFETLGFSSEIVKSTIIGILVGIIAKLTPNNIRDAIRDGIIWVRNTWKTWRQAAEEGKE